MEMLEDDMLLLLVVSPPLILATRLPSTPETT